MASPSQTASPYAPSDGVQADLGTLAIRNLIFISAKQGAPARLTGSLVNKSGALVSVTFTGTALPSVTVPAGNAVKLQDKDLIVNSLDAMPGTLVPLTITSSAGSTSLRVPLLDGSLPEYATLVPTATASPTK